MRLTWRRLIIILFASSILLPGIPIPGLVTLRPEEVIVLALLPAIISTLRARLNRIDLIFGFLGLSCVISTAWGQINGISFNARNLMELVELGKHWLFFRVAFRGWTESDRRHVVSWILGSLAVSAMVGIVQRFNWLGVGTWTRNIYGGSTHRDKARVFGTMRSPNYFGMTIGATFLALIIGTWRQFQRKLKLVVLGGLSLFVVFLTASRTSFVTAAISLMVMTGLSSGWQGHSPLRFRFGRSLIRLLPAILIGGILVISLRGAVRSVQSMSPSEAWNYQQRGPVQTMVFRLGQASAGLEVRKALWLQHLEGFSSSPIVGLGPAKGTFSTIGHSGYVLILQRYGVIGLALFLWLWLTVLRASWSVLHQYPSQSATWGMALALVGITVRYLAGNFLMDVFYHIQLMSLFWMLVGMVYSALCFLPPQEDRW